MATDQVNPKESQKEVVAGVLTTPEHIWVAVSHKVPDLIPHVFSQSEPGISK